MTGSATPRAVLCQSLCLLLLLVARACSCDGRHLGCVSSLGCTVGGRVGGITGMRDSRTVIPAGVQACDLSVSLWLCVWCGCRG